LILQKQSHYFQQLADHPDIVEQVKADAKEEDDLPTRTEVLSCMREKEAEQAQDHVAPLPPGDFNIIYADPPWQYLAS
jgi:16S rRNA G966 N2-methylase RsmD